MKLLFIIIAAAVFLLPLSGTTQAEEQDKTASEKASDAWDKTKQTSKKAAQTVTKTTKNAANAIVETLTPDADARHVQVRLTGSGIEMPKTVTAGKTAFVVKNTAKEDQNFEVIGEGIDREFVFDISPGQTKTLQTNLKRGKYKAQAIRKNGKEKRFEINLTVK
jgi:iron uptake system EfeUOB component EfeO/EfeM